MGVESAASDLSAAEAMARAAPASMALPMAAISSTTSEAGAVAESVTPRRSAHRSHSRSRRPIARRPLASPVRQATRPAAILVPIGAGDAHLAGGINPRARLTH